MTRHQAMEVLVGHSGGSGDQTLNKKSPDRLERLDIEQVGLDRSDTKWRIQIGQITRHQVAIEVLMDQVIGLDKGKSWIY